MEVCQAVLALNLIDAETDFAEGVILVLLEVSERDLDNAALERVVGVPQTGRTVDEGLAHTVSVMLVFNVAGKRCRIMLR